MFLAADELGDGEHGYYSRVGEVVVPEVEVPGVLPTEGGVVLAHLGLDDRVPRLGADGPAPLAPDQLRERLRADGAVANSRLRLLFEDVFGDEGGEQVAGDGNALLVHDKAQAVFGIVNRYIALLHGARVAPVRLGELARGYKVPDLIDALFSRERDGVLAAEFEAVVVLGVVRSGDHGAARLPEVPDGEIESVGRDEADVQHVRAGFGHTLHKRLLQDLAGEAHVAPDNYAGARKVQVVDVGTSHLPGHVLIQGVGVEAPDVVGLEDRLVHGVYPFHGISLYILESS